MGRTSTSAQNSFCLPKLKMHSRPQAQAQLQEPDANPSKNTGSSEPCGVTCPFEHPQTEQAAPWFASVPLTSSQVKLEERAERLQDGVCKRPSYPPDHEEDLPAPPSHPAAPAHLTAATGHTDAAALVALPCFLSAERTQRMALASLCNATGSEKLRGGSPEPCSASQPSTLAHHLQGAWPGTCAPCQPA